MNIINLIGFLVISCLSVTFAYKRLTQNKISSLLYFLYFYYFVFFGIVKTIFNFSYAYEAKLSLLIIDTFPYKVQFLAHLINIVVLICIYSGEQFGSIVFGNAKNYLLKLKSDNFMRNLMI